MEKENINKLEKELAEELEISINRKEPFPFVKCLADKYYSQVFKDSKEGYYNQELFELMHRKYQNYKKEFRFKENN